MKRRSMYVLIVALLVSILSICAWAAETAEPNVVAKPEFEVTVSHVNPEYAALGVKFTKPDADCMTTAETTVNSLEEAAVYLREQMENRVTEVTIKVNNHTYVSNDGLSEDWGTIRELAFAHTGVPTQGDYIMRHYGWSTGSIGHNGISTATFRYTIAYDTTLEQENTVGDRIDELFAEWDAESGFYTLSDYEQVKIIFDYICENVEYDYDNLYDTAYTLKYSAYAALIDGTAVCQGYANLFYRMALELGIDNRIVVGWAKDTSKLVQDEEGNYVRVQVDENGEPLLDKDGNWITAINHGWNIVELGEYYYYLDATWGDAVSTINYDWFLIGSENFGHVSDFDDEASFVGTKEYPVDAEDYVEPASFVIYPAVDYDSGKPVLFWDPVEGAEKYEIWRAKTKDGTYYLMSTTTGTRYVNTIAEPGVTYYYKVRTLSGGVYSEFSLVKEITCVCPRPTVSITVNPDTGKPVLTWKAVNGAAKYEVWRATSKDGTYYKMYTFSGTKYSNTTAVPGVTYYYKVVAVPSAGEKGSSKPSDVKSITCDCAKPVVTASVNPTTGLPTLTWNAVDGATKYEIWRATGVNGTYYKMYTQSGTSYTNTTAVPGKTYYYKVLAICGKSTYGNSAYSAEKSVICSCPQPTISIWTNPSTGYPTLSWTAVKGATKYEIWRATSKDGTYYKMYTMSGTRYANTIAVPGVTYYYKVRALYNNSEYACSEFSSIKSITCDCARPVVTATINQNGYPKLTWNAVNGAVKYEVYRSLSENGTYYKMYTTTDTSYVNVTAESGKTYYYKVVAICGKSSYGNSAYSEIITVAVP